MARPLSFFGPLPSTAYVVVVRVTRAEQEDVLSSSIDLG